MLKGIKKMKIMKIKMICPKCKKEYENWGLASYSSGFESAAKNFTHNNRIITQCENCNTKLVPEFLIDNFDSNGNYAPNQKTIDKGFDLFKLYLEVLNGIRTFFSCVDNGKIVLSANVIDNDEKVFTTIVLTGIDNENTFKLLSATIDEYTYEIGDRKNKFMLLNLLKTTNSILTNIYDYIFIDDCNSFEDKHKQKINKELIDIEHLQ